MMRFLAVLLLVFIASPALAQEPVMEHRFGPGPHFLSDRGTIRAQKVRAPRHVSRKVHVGKSARPVEQTHERIVRYVADKIGGRPEGCPSRAWCGCFLAKHFGLTDRGLWLARNWARIGSAASGPAPGVVVVWPHHVGLIRQVTSNGRAIVLSGNDGRAVRTRERSLRGAIAYRHVGARYASLFQ